MHPAVKSLALAVFVAGCGLAGAKASSLAGAAFPNAAALAVTCPALGAGGAIPARYSAKGANFSPPIGWSAAAGAAAYAVIVQDPDAPAPTPFVHWLIWNIPGGITDLAPGIATKERVSNPPGAIQGRNDADSVGYHGPSPPPGKPHHYYFQVFALNAALPAAPGADAGAVLAALKGRVIAKGQCVGTFQTR